MRNKRGYPMRCKSTIILLICMLVAAGACADRDYDFDGGMSRAVLENYLSRSITMTDLLHGKGDVDDNIRMLKSTGAKFIGRAIYRWGGEAALERLLETAKPIAARLHRTDGDMILQAAAFEIVSDQVSQIPIPESIFKEFGLEPEKRNFRYEAMLYPDGHRVNHWQKSSSVPDMSRLETRMWFVYLAVRYIDIGIEAIHFGQVEIMDDRDPEHVHWRDMLARVRKYAHAHARRGMLICDAHVPSGGIVGDGQLMFDFHSFPLLSAPHRRICRQAPPRNPQDGLSRQHIRQEQRRHHAVGLAMREPALHCRA